MQYSVISGVMMGISGLLAKTALLDIPINEILLFNFLTDPVAWLSAAFGIAGFLYLQKALYRRKISDVVPVVSANATVTPIILSVILLNEFVSPLRWMGVGLIILGVIGISQADDEKNLLNTIFRKIMGSI